MDGVDGVDGSRRNNRFAPGNAGSVGIACKKDRDDTETQAKKLFDVELKGSRRYETPAKKLFDL